jgi:GNAT superfamily N-acetyltransferase
MRVVEYTTPQAYQSRVLPLLLEHECENCSLIGVIGRLVEGKSPTRTGEPTVPLLLSIEEDDRVVGAAIQTPPHAMLAPPLSVSAADLLVDELHRRGWKTGEFVATVPTVHMLADRWRSISGRKYTRFRSLRVFRLDSVIDPPQVGGSLHLATLADLDWLAECALGFARDINEPMSFDPVPHTRRGIEENRLHVWIDDDQPRTMCAWAGPTPNGVRINQVYTPPEFRGRGYASAATAALTRKLLASGRKFCFLFTDVANPTSNSIYQKIGYRPVAQLDHVKFAPSP